MPLPTSQPTLSHSKSSPLHAFFTSAPLFSIAFLLRVVLLLYGLWQDSHSALKYTDIDYLVFTDAARSVAQGASPYERATYRYTPLLAWLLAPSTQLASRLTSTSPVLSLLVFSFGKAVFAGADLLAGWLLLRILRSKEGGGMSEGRAGMFSALWLWNPMVATISTRGSSEGLLGVLVIALLCAVLEKRAVLAGVLLGFGVHFKIYPFIYAPAIVWWMDDTRLGKTKRHESSEENRSALASVVAFVSAERITLGVVSLVVFLGLNVAMYGIYGMDFLQHTYLHHVTRIDHRHNFSQYNILLYLSSALEGDVGGFRIESVAFAPQLLLSCVLIPLVLAKRDLATAMMAQTFAFVTFNKVCTSQYFLWYMVFLPLYLPNSSFLKNPILGISALVLWVASQGAWLHQGYQLEFLGVSTFLPGLWLASLLFFLVNCWILGVIVHDGATASPKRDMAIQSTAEKSGRSSEKK